MVIRSLISQRISRKIIRILISNISLLMMHCILRLQIRRLGKRRRMKRPLKKVGINWRRKSCILFIVIFRKLVSKISSRVGRSDGIKLLLILWTMVSQILEYFQRVVYKIIFILLFILSINLVKKLVPEIWILEMSGMNWMQLRI